MRKTAAISLLVLMLFTTFGTWLFFFTERAMARHEMRERLEKEMPTVTLIISKQLITEKSLEFRRLDDHEIMFDGKMYDISSETDNGDVIVFEGHEDYKEHHAYKKNKQLNDQQSAGNVVLLNIFALNIALYESSTPVMHYSSVPTSSINFSELICQPLQRSLNVTTPPPDHC